MQKLTIVVIDDSPFMSRFLAIYLEKKYTVITYSDSLEALEAIQNGLYCDALITDLDMPKLSGLELIQAIKDLDLDIPIAVVSNSKESAIRLQCFESGADEFIAKPFHPIELEMRISNLLRKCHLKEIERNRAPMRSVFREFVRAAAF
jgi:DNA-binding response OmpR family regulator